MEMLMVIGIIFLMAGLGTTLSFVYLRGQRLSVTAEIITTEMARAQTDAFTQAGDYAHGVRVFSDHLIRFAGASYDSRVTAEDVSTEFPGVVTVSGLTEVVFLLGELSPVTSGVLTIEDSDQTYTVTVSSYGILETTKGSN